MLAHQYCNANLVTTIIVMIRIIFPLSHRYINWKDAWIYLEIDSPTLRILVRMLDLRAYQIKVAICLV
jgi:hypothetical protein